MRRRTLAKAAGSRRAVHPRLGSCPDLVVRDARGEIQTVQYQKLTPMLHSEVRKKHRELEAKPPIIDKMEERLHQGLIEV